MKFLKIKKFPKIPKIDKNIVNILLFLISITLLTYLIMLSDIKKLIELFLRLNLESIILILMISTFSLFLWVFRMKFLLERRYKIGFFALFPVHAYSVALSNMIPGRTSTIMRAAFLKVIKSIPFKFSFVSIFLERLSNIIILTILSTFIVYYIGFSVYLFPLVIIFCAIFVALALMQSRLLKNLFISFINRLGLKDKKMKNDIGIIFRDLKISNFFIIPLAYSLIIWIANGLIFYITLSSLGAEIDVFKVIVFYAFSLIVGLVSLLPGGIGSTEAVLTSLLVSSGIDFSVATASVLIGRFFTLGYLLFVGIIMSFFIKSEKIENIKKLKRLKD